MGRLVARGSWHEEPRDGENRLVTGRSTPCQGGTNPTAPTLTSLPTPDRRRSST